MVGFIIEKVTESLIKKMVSVKQLTKSVHPLTVGDGHQEGAVGEQLSERRCDHLCFVCILRQQLLRHPEDAQGVL